MADPPKANPNPTPSGPSQSAQSAKIIEVSLEEASFTGPLPHPSVLQGYEDVCPGAALRIIGMAEEQGMHRRKLEEKMSDADVTEMTLQFAENRRGQVFALLVAFAFLGAGVWIGVSGNPWPGALLGGLGGGGFGLPTIINAFLRRRGESGPAQERSVPASEPSQKAASR